MINGDSSECRELGSHRLIWVSLILTQPLVSLPLPPAYDDEAGGCRRRRMFSAAGGEGGDAGLIGFKHCSLNTGSRLT